MKINENQCKFAGPWANGVVEPQHMSLLSHLPGEVYLPLPLPRDPGAPEFERPMMVMSPFGHFFSTLCPSTFSTHFLVPKSTLQGAKMTPKWSQKSNLFRSKCCVILSSLFARFFLRSGNKFEALWGRLLTTFLSIPFSFLAFLQHRAFHGTL